MIIYIHGFGGSGQGSKAEALRQHYRSMQTTFIAPSLSYVPELALKTLLELIDACNEDVYLIGSSLGGYYALYLSTLSQVKKVVLLNPAINPTHTLKQAMGYAPNFYDNSSFTWNEDHLRMLEYYDNTEPAFEKILLLTQTGDELLDYREAVEKLSCCEMIIHDGGNHGFESIEQYFEKIDSFFDMHQIKKTILI